MALHPEDIAHIAHLARLEIDPDDVACYVRNLSDLIELVEQMNAIDTRGVQPMAHPVEASQRLRDDAVTESDQHELLQRNAPALADGLYLVPKVIE